jgi:hypothetical protein
MRMKVRWTLAVGVFVAGVLAGLNSEVRGEAPPAWMEELVKDAAEARRELYTKFLPSPKELGPGWLLPWQIPEPLRKFRSEDKFWQSHSGTSVGGSLGVSSGMSIFLGLSPEEVGKVLDQFVAAMAGEFLKDELPAGLSAEACFLGMTLTGVRVGVAASLTKRVELALDYQERMQRLMRERMARLEAAEEEEEKIPRRSSLQETLEVLLEPMKGMGAGEIKEAIVKEVTAVKRMTGMVYAKCDNWEGLKSGDAGPEKVHLGQVTVELIILDRDRVHEKIDDLEPQEVAPLQQRLNGTFRKFLVPVIEMQEKREEKIVGALRKQLQATADADVRERIRGEIRKREEGFKKMQESVSSFEMEVSARDFGDNCYVVSTKGRLESPEFSLPIARLNACLRNGSAVVLIELGGNFTEEQFKKELDRFLSEMDVRTAFFRE